MTNLLSRRLALLSAKGTPLLAQGLAASAGDVARHVDGRPGNHAASGRLGSALTHPQITTDYSESLLEFITPAQPDLPIAGEPRRIHRFAYSKLGKEYVWSPSMPCPLPAEEDIPIAYYGTSNIGQLKHVYRRGLALRYGKTMQCIAGIHYNFSLPEKLWPLLKQAEGFVGTDRDFQSASISR